jgi:hypothetical protein
MLARMGVFPRRRAPLAAIIALAACSLSEQEGGALGNGTFGYDCVTTPLSGAYDAFCPQFDQSAPFPSVIALGSQFRVNYAQSVNFGQTSYPSINVFPVSTDYLPATYASTVTMTAARPGAPWVYAQIPDGRVLDLASVNVQALTSILVGDQSSAIGQAAVGDTHTFTASGQVGAQAAAGAIPYTWSVSAGGALVPYATQSANTTSVTFSKAGAVTVTAYALGASGSATIQVIP